MAGGGEKLEGEVAGRFDGSVGTKQRGVNCVEVGLAAVPAVPARVQTDWRRLMRMTERAQRQPCFWKRLFHLAEKKTD